MQKITEEQFNNFVLEYHRMCFTNPRNKYRFAQAFCNHFKIIDAEVYYEKDNAIATHKIYERYLEK